MIIEEEVYLEHFGVKGMQWGVRKKRFKAAARKAWSNTAIRRTIKVGGGITAGTLALMGMSEIASLASHHEPGPMEYSPGSMQGQDESTSDFLDRVSKEGEAEFREEHPTGEWGKWGARAVTDEDLERGEQYVKDHSDQFKGGFVGPHGEVNDNPRAFMGSETATEDKNIEEHEQWKKDVVTGVYKRRR
jgi:hypothetical protein